MTIDPLPPSPAAVREVITRTVDRSPHAARILETAIPSWRGVEITVVPSRPVAGAASVSVLTTDWDTVALVELLVGGLCERVFLGADSSPRALRVWDIALSAIADADPAEPTAEDVLGRVADVVASEGVEAVVTAEHFGWQLADDDVPRRSVGINVDPPEGSDAAASVYIDVDESPDGEVEIRPLVDDLPDPILTLKSPCDEFVAADFTPWRRGVRDILTAALRGDITLTESTGWRGRSRRHARLDCGDRYVDLHDAGVRGPQPGPIRRLPAYPPAPIPSPRPPAAGQPPGRPAG